MLRISNIKLPIDHSEKDIINKVCKVLKIKDQAVSEFSIFKKSLDSRKKNNIHYIYSIDVSVKDESKYVKVPNVKLVEKQEYVVPQLSCDKRPIIVGAGPAGLYVALILAEAGLKPLVLERGSDVDTRKLEIDKFWATGELNPNSNVQFGAGGAGTFSDGKLTTGTKDPRRVKFLKELIAAGAPEEIEYMAKPHVGTDILINVVRNLDQKITRLGGEIIYNAHVYDFQTDQAIKAVSYTHEGQEYTVETDHLVMAIGHSARDTFELMHQKEIAMKAKPFSVGVRIEHLQSELNYNQFGELCTSLPAAEYKVNMRTREDNRGVYTFCMCPGGVVVAASSEPGMVVTNGMSYYARDLENANSALLVSINPEDFGGDVNPLAGIEFQRSLERSAFEHGGSNYHAPAQLVKDFQAGIASSTFGKVTPSYAPGVKLTNLHDVLPEFICEALSESLNVLAGKLEIFGDGDAVMTAVESRSSSPVTIIRDDQYNSSIKGLYPCGEGAGYAGGIVSAAIDGIRTAEKVLSNIIDNAE
ncbi:FAD-dependent oxidoreductase [Mollicutes bacterium LVI A0039]|nr:FAD-dependent oxidoreductase [Mollicutes bacterium LVI A0039]